MAAADDTLTERGPSAHFKLGKTITLFRTNRNAHNVPSPALAMTSRRVWKDHHENNDAGVEHLKKRKITVKDTAFDDGEGPTAYNARREIAWLSTTIENSTELREVELVKHNISCVAEPFRRYESMAFSRVPDINAEDVSKSVVTTVNFHPGDELVCTGGLDTHVRIFKVDCKANEKVHTLAVGAPVFQVEFCRENSSEHIIVAGREQLLFGHVEKNLIEKAMLAKGAYTNAGFIQSPDSAFIGVIGSSQLTLISQKSRTGVMTLRSNSRIKAASFDIDGHHVFGCTDDGFLHYWDIRTQRCVKSAPGFGGVKKLCVPESSGKIITGCDNGITQVFSIDSIEWSGRRYDGKVAQRAEKTLSNLCSEITTLETSRKGDMIAFASSLKRNSLRLFHIPSLKVIEKWPTASTPLNYVSACALNYDGSLLAIGNTRGRVLAYRISTQQ